MAAGTLASSAATGSARPMLARVAARAAAEAAELSPRSERVLRESAVEKRGERASEEWWKRQYV